MKSVRVSPSIFSRFPFELADHVEKNLRVVSRGNEPIGILFFLFNRSNTKQQLGERGTRLNYRIEQRGEGKGKVALELHAQTSWSRSAYLRPFASTSATTMFVPPRLFVSKRERGRESERKGKGKWWMDGRRRRRERDWRR